MGSTNLPANDAYHTSPVTEMEYEVSGPRSSPQPGRQEQREQSKRTENERSGNRSNQPERQYRQRKKTREPYRFIDGFEYDMCQMVSHRGPDTFPVNGRSELATSPPVEVDRDGNRVLLCDRIHAGPHIWPGGEEVER